MLNALISFQVFCLVSSHQSEDNCPSLSRIVYSRASGGQHGLAEVPHQYSLHLACLRLLDRELGESLKVFQSAYKAAHILTSPNLSVQRETFFLTLLFTIDTIMVLSTSLGTPKLLGNISLSDRV